MAVGGLVAGGSVGDGLVAGGSVGDGLGAGALETGEPLGAVGLDVGVVAVTGAELPMIGLGLA